MTTFFIHNTYVCQNINKKQIMNGENIYNKYEKKVELLQMIEKSPASGKMNKVHVQLGNRERKTKRLVTWKKIQLY